MLGSTIGRLLLVGALAALLPQDADAQLKGLIKKKIGDKAKGAPKEAQATEATFKRGPNDVVITTPVLNAFKKGLKTEIALRAELEKELAKLKTPEDYQACKTATMQSPENQQIQLKALTSLGENPKQEDAVKMAEKMKADGEALILKKCGVDPRTVDKFARLKAIQQKAAEAAGPIERASGGDNAPAAPAGPFFALADAVSMPATAPLSGMTLEEYVGLEERIPPFCDWAKTQNGGAFPSVVKVAGTPGNFFGYTSAEAQALSPECPELSSLIAQVK